MADEEKKSSSKSEAGKKTMAGWGKAKKNLGSAVGASNRQNIKPDKLLTESEYDRAIAKYRGESPPRHK